MQMLKVVKPDYGEEMAQALTVGNKLLGRRVNAWRQRLVVTALLATDLCAALLVYGAALALFYLWRPEAATGLALSVILGSVAVWLGLRTTMGLYPGYGMNPVEELRRQGHAVALTLAITAVFALAIGAGSSLTLLPITAAFVGLSLIAPLVRYFVKLSMRRLGLWGKPVVVMVSTRGEMELVSTLEREWELGFRPVAVVDERTASGGRLIDYASYESSLARTEELAIENGIDTVILAMSRIRRDLLAQIASRLDTSFRNVTVVPDIGGVANSAAVSRDLGGTFGVEIRQNLLNHWAKRTKRILDLFGVLVGGLLVSPLLLGIAVLIKLEAGGPVLYKDVRMGHNNRPFLCMKFRTMVPDAEAILQRILTEDIELNEQYARYHKLRDDPRVTRVGRFLRKTSLDELPQLWNVLRGEMSLVGPRPYLPRESVDIGIAQSAILRVHPGITGPWQVSGRSIASFDERVRMDSYYVRNWSVWMDILLLARTVGSVLFSRSAY